MTSDLKETTDTLRPDETAGQSTTTGTSEPQLPMSRRALVWVVLIFFMGSVLFADLMRPGVDDQALGLSVATFLMGARGTSELPEDLEYRQAWSSRLGATVPAKAWIGLLSSPDGIRIDSARHAMALWGAGLMVIAMLVLLAGARDPLVPCLALTSTLWIRAWQHLADGSRVDVHYAWDFPAVLLFAVVLVLMARHRILPALAIAAAGVSIKLTAGVWMLAIPFVRHWSWRRRAVTFVVGGGTCLLVKLTCDLMSGNRLLLTPNAVGQDGTSRLLEHLWFLARPGLEHPIFIGGGLVLAALLCISRRHLGLVAVIAGFIGGQMLFAEPGEYRVYLEIMPVAAWIVADRARTLVPSHEVAAVG